MKEDKVLVVSVPDYAANFTLPGMLDRVTARDFFAGCALAGLIDAQFNDNTARKYIEQAYKTSDSVMNFRTYKKPVKQQTKKRGKK